MDIAELIKRVEGLTGADGGIDSQIEWTLSEWKNIGSFWREHKVTGERKRFHYRTSPAYTASVDAVIQLIGEKMGTTEAEWHVGRPTVDGPYYAALRGHTSAPIDGVHGEALTPALALLLAFLRAWEARGEKA